MTEEASYKTGGDTEEKRGQRRKAGFTVANGDHELHSPDKNPSAPGNFFIFF